MVRGKQFTVCWHVDDVKASHDTQEALDEFAEWVQELYGEYSDVKVTRGKELCLILVPPRFLTRYTTENKK